MKNNKVLIGLLVIGLVATGSAFASVKYSSGSTSHFGMKNMMGDRENKLTTEEKTALSKMTSDQRKAFINKKEADFKAIRDSKEAVIDKLLNYETLTDADKSVVEQIKKDRVEKKLRRAKMEEFKTLMQKQKSGTILTVEEQKKVDDFKASMPKMGKSGKMGMGMGKMRDMK